MQVQAVVPADGAERMPDVQIDGVTSKKRGVTDRVSTSSGRACGGDEAGCASATAARRASSPATITMPSARCDRRQPTACSTRVGGPREAGAVGELAAAAADQAAQPVNQGREPVEEAGQEREVDERPGQPTRSASGITSAGVWPDPPGTMVEPSAARGASSLRREIGAVLGAGLLQGLALVTFPAASAVFTSRAAGVPLHVRAPARDGDPRRAAGGTDRGGYVPTKAT